MMHRNDSLASYILPRISGLLVPRGSRVANRTCRKSITDGEKRFNLNTSAQNRFCRRLISRSLVRILPSHRMTRIDSAIQRGRRHLTPLAIRSCPVPYPVERPPPRAGEQKEQKPEPHRKIRARLMHHAKQPIAVELHERKPKITASIRPHRACDLD